MRLITCGGLALALLTMPGVASAKKCTDDAALATAREAAAAQCDCATAKNHGDYVSCVAKVANSQADHGNLPSECKGEVVECAAHSTCGKQGAVTCCRVDTKGKVKCSIKSSASKCKASHGGVACVGAAASCCDSCGAGGGGSADGAFTCGGSTTSSTTPVTTTSSSTSAPTTSTGVPTTSTAAPTTSSSSTLVVATTSSTSTTLAGSPSGAFSDR